MLPRHYWPRNTAKTSSRMSLSCVYSIWEQSISPRRHPSNDFSTDLSSLICPLFLSPFEFYGPLPPYFLFLFLSLLSFVLHSSVLLSRFNWLTEYQISTVYQLKHWPVLGFLLSIFNCTLWIISPSFSGISVCSLESSFQINGLLRYIQLYVSCSNVLFSHWGKLPLRINEWLMHIFQRSD